jgi:phenylalanine-4-hydroxylase
MIRPTKQVYSNYTAEDFAVWKTLFTRQMSSLEHNVSFRYLNAIEKVKFNADEIPDFKKVDSILLPATGWSMEVVPNICPQKEFFEFLSQKKFTATCWLRTMEQLDYLEEPDMFHDVFGHVPLLSDQAYCSFFLELSKIALQHIHNPLAIELLGRMYWFTIEFGMIQEQGHLKIYGAGIISSRGETIHAISNHTEKREFDVQEIINTPYRNDIIQDKYFVIESFHQLYSSVPLIKSCLEQKLLEAEINIK